MIGVCFSGSAGTDASLARRDLDECSIDATKHKAGLATYCHRQFNQKTEPLTCINAAARSVGRNKAVVAVAAEEGRSWFKRTHPHGPFPS
jgi:hypothetical protein